MNFSQSGNLGDLIYSLSVVKKLGPGNFYVKLNNIPNVIVKYNNGHVPPEYVGKLSQKDFDMLKPLLEAQEYIKRVGIYKKQKIDVDLDEFRGVIHSKVQGNFLKAFYITHNIPFTDEDLIQPWLTVPNPNRVAKFVVARSPRWRRMYPNTVDIWRELINNNNIEKEGVFIGLPEEHTDFENTMNVKIPYHPVKDFLELAEVIAGADAFFSNQTFTYGIAQGLCKTTVLETFSARPNLQVNECFFARPNCYYF
jgi:hypothetical protein